MSKSAQVNELNFFLFFDLRAILDFSSIDIVNYDAWKELIAGISSVDLEFSDFMSNLVHKSYTDIRDELYPYMDDDIWIPLVEAYREKVVKGVKDFHYAEALPIPGLKDFLLDCAKHSSLITVLLSPLPKEAVYSLLAISGLSSFFYIVVEYARRDDSLVEAIHRAGILFPPCSPDPELRSCSSTSEDAYCRIQLLEDKSNILFFTSDIEGATESNRLGIKFIGVTANNSYFEECDKGITQPQKHLEKKRPISPEVQAFVTPRPSRTSGTDSTVLVQVTQQNSNSISLGEELLAHGAYFVLKDYSTMKYEYLATK